MPKYGVVSGEKNIWAIHLIDYLLFMFFVERFMCFLYFSHEPKAAFLCFFLCWDMVSIEWKRILLLRRGSCTWLSAPKMIRALSCHHKRIGSQKVSFSYCIYARGIFFGEIPRVVFIFSLIKNGYFGKKVPVYRRGGAYIIILFWSSWRGLWRYNFDRLVKRSLSVWIFFEAGIKENKKAPA